MAVLAGSYKYAIGINAFVNGFFWNDIYYSILVGYTAISNISTKGDFDRLNPSQLINVRSDLTHYLGHRGLSIDQAYAQKNWALGNGLYTRVAGGYFEVEYGGVAAEILYYPLKCPWAIGIEGANIEKAGIHGIGVHQQNPQTRWVYSRLGKSLRNTIFPQLVLRPESRADGVQSFGRKIFG